MPAVGIPTTQSPPAPTDGPLAADLRARQNDILTALVTRPDGSVVTAVVTLGNSPPSAASTTSALPPGATGTSAPYVGSGANNNLSQAAIGAILGSVVGVVALGLVLYFCAFNGGRSHDGSGSSTRSSRRRSYYSSSSSSSGSSSTSSSGTTSTSDSEKSLHKYKSGKTRTTRVTTTTTRAVRGAGMRLNPPPVNIPPTAPPPAYRATRTVQFGGVSRYP